MVCAERIVCSYIYWWDWKGWTMQEYAALWVPLLACVCMCVCVCSLPLKPSHSLPAKTHQQLYTATGPTVALVAMIPDSNICIEY